MNKYQQSYQKLTNRIYKYDHIEDVYKDLEVLGELVDRAIEVEPFKESLADYMCPMCGAGLSFDALNDPIEYAPKFCSNCGQKLDWSKEEENCDEE